MAARVLFSVSILVAIITLSESARINEEHALRAADHTLMKFMMTSKFSDDPLVSIKCFSYYMPVLTNITVDLSKSFQNCTAQRDRRIKSLSDAAKIDRNRIHVASNGVCIRLEACNRNADTLAFFDCISGQGSQDEKILYTVTQNATEKGADLREHYRLCEVEKYKCQNASERTYIQNTAKAYTQLDFCLQTGKITWNLYVDPVSETPVTTSTVPTPTYPAYIPTDFWPYTSTSQDAPLAPEPIFNYAYAEENPVIP